MQAFWVIQPHRNNQIIQLEKAWTNEFFLSSEAAKVYLEEIRNEEWSQEEIEDYGDPSNFEVVALVADWPPSQFDKKPQELDRLTVKLTLNAEQLLQELDAIFGTEDVQEVEEEPEWLPIMRDISPVVQAWNETELTDAGLIFLGTALEAYEQNDTIEVEFTDGPRWSISPVPETVSVVTFSPAPQPEDNV